MMHIAAKQSGRFFFILFIVLCAFFCSCSTVRNYPADKPFVYATNITIKGKFNADQRKELANSLEQQLHDSMRVRTVQKLIFWSSLRNPPVYDSANADKSVQFMKALLYSQGHYRDSITYTTIIDTVKAQNDTQYRARTNFIVYPGKITLIDSVSYNLRDDTLLAITRNVAKESLLKKGAPFAKGLISTEFNRLTDEYRNRGYLRFSFEELLAVYDTVGLAFLRPTLDPLEQAEQLAELQRRRENPSADIEITLRANRDTSHLVRYHVGDVTIYPDLTADSAQFVANERNFKGYKYIAYHNLYKPEVVTENVYLRRGDLYSQRNYLKTLNRFNTIGTWRLVSIDQVPRGTTDTVDFVVRLTPANKYAFNANIEGSQNFGSNTFINGNLIGFNLGLQNRNFARRAYTTVTNIRFATEVTGRRNLLANQASFTHTIFIPKVLPNLHLLSAAVTENSKTSFSINGGYTTRREFFDLSSLNVSWGYDFNWNNKLFFIRFPNIEYAYLQPGRLLDSLYKINQSFQYIFNSGLIASTIAGFTMTRSKKNISNVVRFNFESSGLAVGLIRSKFIDSNLQRFVKLDAEFRQTISIRRSAFAWRLLGGIGSQFRNNERFFYNKFLPFYRSYVAGGANSMRAWPLRRLGPGSAVKSFSPTIAPDRFGEMILEANGEYRFYVMQIGGIKINSALFVDMGNVWYLNENTDFPGGEFRFNKLWKDVAIGAGTGLRADFGFFLIRLDYAYKLKDPSPEDISLQNKFFPNRKLTGGQLQLGVTYPF